MRQKRNLQFDLLILRREKVKLGDLVSGVAFHLDTLTVFEIPFPLAVEQALFDIGFHIRMHRQGDVLFVLFDQDIIEIIFDIVQ